MKAHLGHLAPFLAIVLTAGCTYNPVKVNYVTLAEAAYVLDANAMTGAEPSSHTQQILAELDLSDDLVRDPYSLAEKLAQDTETVPRWERCMARAEICYLLGNHSNVKNPSEHFLEAALVAHDILVSETSGPHALDPRRSLLRNIYNRGLTRFFILKQRSEGHPKNWTEARSLTGEYNFIVKQEGDHHCSTLDYFDYFVASDTIEYTGMRNRHRIFGVGTSLVAFRNSPSEENGREPEPYMPGGGRSCPCTAILERLPDSGDDGRSTLLLSFVDPYHADSIRRRGQDVPINADYSAPLAYWIAKSQLPRIEQDSFFKSDVEGLSGIYMMQPYDTHRIPVIMVHGLWESPLAWRDMNNDIMGDRWLRENYQVWHYLYPTGAPIIQNARKFRDALQKTIKALSPEGDTNSMKGVVVIGHSMGGVLARIMLQQSKDDKLWSTAFDKPIDELDLGDNNEFRADLKNAFYFEPVPCIDRVIFISTPHRGSEMAERFIGKLGIWMISLPKQLVSRTSTLVQRNPGALKIAVPTSVEMLSRSNQLSIALANLEMSEDVPYHSIMGDHTGKSTPEESTDGVVPHSSSHLDGARSELIVHADHNAHEHPKAIAEVRRILRLHLKELEEARKAKAKAAAGR